MRGQNIFIGKRENYTTVIIKYLLLSRSMFFFLQDSWVKDLEVRLEKFLTLALKSTPQPRLFDIYVSFCKKKNQTFYAVRSSAPDKKYNRNNIEIIFFIYE